MSFLKFHTCTLAAMLALTGVGVMQGAEQGTFHLTQQVFWGRVVLQPGDYKLFVPDAPLDEVNVRVESSNGKSVFELPRVANTGEVTGTSYLKLTSVGGDYYVTEYAAGSVGKTFEFSMPKPAHRLQQAGATGMTSLIAITK